MKLISTSTLMVLLVFFALLDNGCGLSGKKEKDFNHNANDTIKTQSDYEFAHEFLLKLRNNKIDSIVFYKRTCIGCCDFYNIFWKSNGRTFLKKIHAKYDEEEVPCLNIIEINNDKIFLELYNNYVELKTKMVKANTRKLKNGYSLITETDHYCYTQIDVFSSKDSILSGSIKNHDFEKYTSIDQKDGNQLNDNFVENNKSKWNLFLQVVESGLAGMRETQARERTTFRTFKVER